MPFLNEDQTRPLHWTAATHRSPLSETEAKSMAPALFPVCSNPGCRAGRFRLWRSRQTPVLEGGWLCSPDCTRVRLRQIVAREMDGRSERPMAHRHRIPLGLIMLAQGWISQTQLRAALSSQLQSGKGRLGDWLISDAGLDEQVITRALGLQWNCPVFSLDGHQPELVSAVLPRLFIDSFGLVPVRATHSQTLHIGFEDRLDPSMTFAIERMSGMRVEAGLLNGPDFRRAHPQMLAAIFPKTRLVEADGLESLVRVLSMVLEDVKAVEARLVRVHDFFWFRLWKMAPAGSTPRREDVEDVVCSLMQADPLADKLSEA